MPVSSRTSLEEAPLDMTSTSTPQTLEAGASPAPAASPAAGASPAPAASPAADQLEPKSASRAGRLAAIRVRDVTR